MAEKQMCPVDFLPVIATVNRLCYGLNRIWLPQLIQTFKILNLMLAVNGLMLVVDRIKGGGMTQLRCLECHPDEKSSR